MTPDALRAFALSLPATSEDQPFGPDVLVFRVARKIFALLSLDTTPLRVNLKQDPEAAVERREAWDAVHPGYHMNKTHWNTVILDGSVPAAEVREWVGESYGLVRASLPRREREALDPWP